MAASSGSAAITGRPTDRSPARNPDASRTVSNDMSPPHLSEASDQQVVAWAREGREDAYRELVPDTGVAFSKSSIGWLATASWPNSSSVLLRQDPSGPTGVARRR